MYFHKYVKLVLQAKVTMELYANRVRKSPDNFAVGDNVFLSTKNIGTNHLTHSAKKLQKRFIGPFPITERVSEYTFKLQLPKSMSKLHPVFHVSLLWKQKPTPEELQNRITDELSIGIPNVSEPSAVPPAANATNTSEPQLPTSTATTSTQPTDEPDDDPTFEVEAILDRQKSGNSYQYRVKWRGYPDTDNTWEPRKNFLGNKAREMIHAFDTKIKASSSTSSTANAMDQMNMDK